MAISNKISATSIWKLPDGKYCDGNGLYLRVRGGSRTWVFRFRWDGKRYDHGLGSVKYMSLKAARAKATEIRNGINNGVFPIAVQTKEKQETAVAYEANYITLRKIVDDAAEYYKELRRVRKKYFVRDAVKKLTKNVLPHIGDVPINSITPKDVATALKPFAGSTYFNEMLRHTKMCFMYAIAQGWIKNNPCEWKGGIDAYLPSINFDNVKHYNCIHWKDLQVLYKHLVGRPIINYTLPLIVMCLCPLRSDEVWRVKMCDVNFETRTFIIHGNKTTTKDIEYSYPPQLDFIFKDKDRECAFLTKDAITKGYALLRLKQIFKELFGTSDVTLHGFRATFSTWCADNGKDSETRELCLLHTIEGQTARSYQRSSLIERRRSLLQEYADFVTGSSHP